MVLRNMDRLICMNPECKAEVLIVKAPCQAATKPLCVCGGEMKKIYQSPQLRILDERERLLRLSNRS